MKISGFLEGSFQDYEGRLCSVIFAPGCNLKCPACHAASLLSGGENYTEEEILKRLSRRINAISRVVITGGEPTLQPDLAEFARQLKNEGLLVKLDTNGTNPRTIFDLSHILDYVAMDVKGPRELYPTTSGIPDINLTAIERSMKIAQNFSGYEFRTTVAPVEREQGTINFMTAPEIAGTARWIRETTGNNSHKYYLQPFVPRRGELINPKFEEFPETPMSLLEEAKLAAIKYLPNTKIRGR
ncbi:MAG: anaerobic ribonucleoside-triphosphate reductase activating protein [Candidatus Pacearchaeota archaeon]|nr:anaerobic ribonucleoside-triphosphate reductase activating protein [Candidatus Pacearchaeota archaeon]